MKTQTFKKYFFKESFKLSLIKKIFELFSQDLHIWVASMNNLTKMAFKCHIVAMVIKLQKVESRCFTTSVSNKVE